MLRRVAAGKRTSGRCSAQIAIKTKDKMLRSTKPDPRNHGVGLSSVYRAVAKYQGTVVIEDSIPENFYIRVLLYGNQE